MPARGTSRARRDSALEKRLPPLRPFCSPQEKASLCWPLPFQRFARSSALAPAHALGVIVLSAQLCMYEALGSARLSATQQRPLCAANGGPYAGKIDDKPSRCKEAGDNFNPLSR